MIDLIAGCSGSNEYGFQVNRAYLHRFSGIATCTTRWDPACAFFKPNGIFLKT